MKVGIFMEGNLNNAGGRERVVIDLIKALDELGHEVHLCSPFKLNKKLIKDLYQDINIKKEYYLKNKLVKKIAMGSIARKFFLIKQFRKMAKNTDAIFDLEGGLVHNFIPRSFKKSNYIVWRVGIPLSTVKTKGYLREAHKTIADIILRPSNKFKIVFVDKFTEDEIKKYWGLSSGEFLYPSIQVSDLKYNNEKKENLITALGRIAPSKKIEVAIDTCASVFKKKKNYKLCIIGGLDEKDKDYFNFLKNKIKVNKMEKNTEVIVNAPFSTIIDKLLKSKILINAQENISIHIAVVEAMAAGCIPIVHKSGGSWHDIVKDGQYGFGFDNYKDCSKTVLSILDTKKTLDKYKKIAIKRADDFSENAFRKNVKKILDSLNIS